MINDLKTDPTYGDFIVQNDLVMIFNDDLLYNILVERLHTAYGDFRLAQDMGANIEGFVGMDINDRLIEDMELAIINSLSWDNLLDSGKIEVIIVPTGLHQLYVRVIVKSPFTNEELVVSDTYSLEGIMLYDQ